MSNNTDGQRSTFDPIGVAVFLVEWILGAWILSLFWAWFVVPTGLRPIGILTAAGLELVVWLVLRGRVGPRTTWVDVLISQAVLFALGGLVHTIQVGGVRW